MIPSFEICLTGESANAVPHTEKLRARVTHIWGNRRGQPDRSAMERPRPGRSAFLITDPPAPGKYALRCHSTSTCKLSSLASSRHRGEQHACYDQSILAVVAHESHSMSVLAELASE